MISDEDLKGIINSDVRHSALLVELAKELLSHRKAWSEPACYVNASDIERKELHVLARQIKSKSCTLPLYRKPDTGEV